MAIKVLMASHLNCDARYKTIEWALKSIEDAKPDHIYLSCSYENGKKPMLPILSCPYSFYFHENRKLQFEHFQFLLQFVDDNDIVCFLDDDDLMTPDKISIVSENFKDPNVNVIRHLIAPFEFFQEEPTISRVENIKVSFSCMFWEYCSLCIRGFKFKEWFKENYNFNGFSDIVFCNSFSPDIKINQILTYFRKSNHKRNYNRITN